MFNVTKDVKLDLSFIPERIRHRMTEERLEVLLTTLLEGVVVRVKSGRSSAVHTAGTCGEVEDGTWFAVNIGTGHWVYGDVAWLRGGGYAEDTPEGYRTLEEDCTLEHETCNGLLKKHYGIDWEEMRDRFR